MFVFWNIWFKIVRSLKVIVDVVLKRYINKLFCEFYVKDVKKWRCRLGEFLKKW